MRRRSVRHHQYVTSGESGKLKFATRHLAALDFLQSVTMKNELKIIESGMSSVSNNSNSMPGDEYEENEQISSGKKGELDTAELLKLQAEKRQHHLHYREDILLDDALVSGGRKLAGLSAPTVHVSKHLRYRMCRLNEQSAMYKQWEDATLNSQHQLQEDSQPQPLMSSRMFFSRNRGYPTALLSVIPYDNKEEKSRQEQKRAEANHWLRVYKQPVRDWRGVSYKSYFHHQHQHQQQQQQGGNKDSGSDQEASGQAASGGGGGVLGKRGLFGDHEKAECFRHDPSLLDDPDMTQGKHRYILRSDAATGPVMTSVILHVNHKELKQDLNDQFREKFPHLPASLTLSKIRNLKKKTLLACVGIGIEISTVAISFIFFEQLVLKALIAKENRKLSMAVCLLLAAKFNEEKLLLDPLFDFFDRVWSLDKKEVISAELGAFVNLDFSLHVAHQHILVVYTRLLKVLLKSSKGYLGEEAHGEYTITMSTWKREREELLGLLLQQQMKDKLDALLEEENESSTEVEEDEDEGEEDEDGSSTEEET